MDTKKCLRLFVHWVCPGEDDGFQEFPQWPQQNVGTDNIYINKQCSCVCVMSLVWSEESFLRFKPN